MFQIKTPNVNTIIAFSLLCFSFSAQLFAKEWLVESEKSYKETVKQLKPGDKVILQNGTWTDFEIVFDAQGTAEQPIELTAETKGKVILSGQSNLKLAGNYLLVSGLVFKDGFTPSGEVISFKRNGKNLANHSRVTEVVIDNYSNPDRFESDYWVGLYGKYNRFDHNHLVGKRNKGVTLAVRLNSKESQENHHIIDYNYFGPRPTFGSNGGETLRIGTSSYSLTNSYTLVENNYFDRTNGEVEIISIKSGKNHIRNNTFFEARGTLTMRHGNGNIIEDNVFKGNGVDHTGGIRVINRDQIVRNNYLEGLTGYRFGSGFTVMNGVPNSAINRYHQVVNATVENNSFINVEHIHLAAGSDAERSASPKDSRINENLIFNENQKAPFSVFDDISGISFKGNISNELKDNKITSGITVKPLELKRAENGLLYPSDDSITVGASRSLSPINKADTGTHWYAKTEPDVVFGSGKTIVVSPSDGALFDAAKNAKSGDVLLLKNGSYNVEKIISINKTLTLRAENKHQATITFARSSLFEIIDGGSLALDSLTISGHNSPDSSGNTLARTAKWGMQYNYRLTVKNSLIKNLNVNHSFHFFDSGSRAFASTIDIQNNVFENITGDLFRLNKETDDLGIYNAEYLNISHNELTNIDGALVNLYRGGTDESTFGPHLFFNENAVNNSGNGKRNKAKATIKLHGVQVAKIGRNTFSDSTGVVVEHTVGEPITTINDNDFSNTPAPSIIEYHVKGQHTAELTNNKVH